MHIIESKRICLFYEDLHNSKKAGIDIEILVRKQYMIETIHEYRICMYIFSWNMPLVHE